MEQQKIIKEKIRKKVKQKDYQSICKKLALVCKLMANSEEHKIHKKKLLKYAGEFEGLSKIKFKEKIK